MDKKDLEKVRKKFEESMQKDIEVLMQYKNASRNLEIQIAEKRGGLELLDSLINEDKKLLEMIKEGEKK
ncbi:hypothetical protein ES705_11212 [subsurface metagenome]